MTVATPEKLTEIFTTMVRIRSFEQRIMAEYRQGHLPGFMHSSIGQEAVPAAFCSFLRQDDYVLTTHRGHGDIAAKGARIDRMMAELYSKATGYCKGRGGSLHVAAFDLNILGATGIVADGIPIAAGVGLGCVMKKLDRVVVAFFGDGATSCGAFHEGVGLAAVWRLPVLFVCSNNLYAHSTPMREYTRLTDLSERARSYGIPGITVDGNDAVALAEVAAQAVADTRGGKGPMLIVCNTYRHFGHHMGEPGTAYRTKEEIEHWKTLDPIDRLQALLLARNFATPDGLERIRSAALEEIEAAVAFAVASPEPGLDEAIADNYA